MIRRLNIWGGPGCGKSVTTAWLFAQLKIAGHDIQFVEEHVKKWAYQKRQIISFDQMHLSTAQVSSEDELLRAGVSHIITESPCMLGYFYAKRDGLRYADLIVDLVRHVDAVYPSLNVFLYRDVIYQQKGRYETEEGAKEIDRSMLEFLKNEYKDLIITSPKDKEALFKQLDDALCRSVRDSSH